MNSTLRLFKALPVDEGTIGVFDADLAKQTIASGFIFAPKVAAHYTDRQHLIQMVDDLYGRNPEQLNQSFHKSWEKVRTAPIAQLVLEQITHYLTTYGFESIGIYDRDLVYIPAEQLDVPELDEGLRLVIIRGFTKDELKAKLLELLGLGVALHEDTISDVLDVATFVGLTAIDLPRVANREVRAALYDYLNIVPSDPTEFLRFVVYRATGKTLLIKNPGLIEEIKAAQPTSFVRYFDLYEKEYGLQRLAQVFYRFKPLFLALRTNTKMKQMVNRIRRLAVTHHKPMTPDLLNSVTATLANGVPIGDKVLSDALASTTTFRKIRLAYALKFRTSNANSILYHIRNGKSWATDFNFGHPALAQVTYEHVLESIVSDIAKKVDGQRIFIPEGVQYGLPATEKQFSGNVPTGTSVETSGGMVAGVHWENQGNHRIDLDLSLQSVDGKFGWDAEYRSTVRDVLFSGDITDAPLPGGASEFFAVSPDARGVWLMMCNYYNYMAEVPVPFKILVAQSAPRSLTKNYTIDPNLLVAQTISTMDVHQKVIGLIVGDDKSCRFYFSESDFGAGRSSRLTRHGEQARDFLTHRFLNTISLNEVLVSAGAELVKSVGEADIDLSLETIDKASLLTLIAG
jgi:hypothetical protein